MKPINRTLTSLALCAMGLGAALASNTKFLTQDEAKKLAFEAMEPQNNIGLFPMPNDYSPGFYVFEVVSPRPETAIVVGHVAVDSRTANVWDLAGNCRMLTSSHLRVAQKHIRAQLGIDKRMLEIYGRKKPNCDAM